MSTLPDILRPQTAGIAALADLLRAQHVSLVAQHAFCARQSLNCPRARTFCAHSAPCWSRDSPSARPASLVRESDAFLRAPDGSVFGHPPLLGKGEPEPAELDAFLAAQSRSCVSINGFSARRTKI